MAGSRIVFPQFRDEQSDSRYPFVDAATLLTTNRLDAGKNTIIDAVIHVIGGQRDAYLSAVEVSIEKVTLWIGDQSENKTCFAEFRTTGDAIPDTLPLLDQYRRPAGLLIVDPVAAARFAGWPEGENRFRPEAAAFVATVVIPAQEPGVRAVLPPTAEFMTDDIWLIGDRGVVVRAESDTVIRFDLVGEPLFERFLCGPLNKFAAPTFIKTINGCPPDEYGNFTITATNIEKRDTTLRVYPDNNALRIDLLGAKVL